MKSTLSGGELASLSLPAPTHLLGGESPGTQPHLRIHPVNPLEYIPGWNLQLWGSLCPQACLQASPLSPSRGLTQSCHPDPVVSRRSYLLPPSSLNTKLSLNLESSLPCPWANSPEPEGVCPFLLLCPPDIPAIFCLL